MVRQVNFSYEAQNRSAATISAAMYERKALDCTSALPMIVSLNHLAYLVANNRKIRDLLCVDGGLERIIQILRDVPKNYNLHGRPHTNKDMQPMWKWTTAFQCAVHLCIRGGVNVRERAVEAGIVPILVKVLESYLCFSDAMRAERKRVAEERRSQRDETEEQRVERMQRAAERDRDRREWERQASLLAAASATHGRRAADPSNTPEGRTHPARTAVVPTHTRQMQDHAPPVSALRQSAPATTARTGDTSPLAASALPHLRRRPEASSTSSSQATSASSSASSQVPQSGAYSESENSLELHLQQTRPERNREPSTPSHRRSSGSRRRDQRAYNEEAMALGGPGDHDVNLSTTPADGDVPVAAVPSSSRSVLQEASVPLENQSSAEDLRSAGGWSESEGAEDAEMSADCEDLDDSEADASATERDTPSLTRPHHPATRSSRAGSLSQSREEPEDRRTPRASRRALAPLSNNDSTHHGRHPESSVHAPSMSSRSDTVVPSASRPPQSDAALRSAQAHYLRERQGTITARSRPILPTTYIAETFDATDMAFREEEVLLSLQILAYLTKYAHIRALLRFPEMTRASNLQDLDELWERAQTSPGTPMWQPGQHFNRSIYTIAERYTCRATKRDPGSEFIAGTTKLAPLIQYWAGVVMRNACRKDDRPNDPRSGLRQCGNMLCGKWETQPREFAKCRRCKKAKFCSKVCQSTSWQIGHKYWCSSVTEDHHESSRARAAARAQEGQGQHHDQQAQQQDQQVRTDASAPADQSQTLASEGLSEDNAHSTEGHTGHSRPHQAGHAATPSTVPPAAPAHQGQGSMNAGRGAEYDRSLLGSPHAALQQQPHQHQQQHQQPHQHQHQQQHQQQLAHQHSRYHHQQPHHQQSHPRSSHPRHSHRRPSHMHNGVPTRIVSEATSLAASDASEDDGERPSLRSDNDMSEQDESGLPRGPPPAPMRTDIAGRPLPPPVIAGTGMGLGGVEGLDATGHGSDDAFGGRLTPGVDEQFGRGDIDQITWRGSTPTPDRQDPSGLSPHSLFAHGLAQAGSSGLQQSGDRSDLEDRDVERTPMTGQLQLRQPAGPPYAQTQQPRRFPSMSQGLRGREVPSAQSHGITTTAGATLPGRRAASGYLPSTSSSDHDLMAGATLMGAHLPPASRHPLRVSHVADSPSFSPASPSHFADAPAHISASSAAMHHQPQLRGHPFGAHRHPTAAGQAMNSHQHLLIRGGIVAGLMGRSATPDSFGINIDALNTSSSSSASSSSSSAQTSHGSPFHAEHRHVSSEQSSSVQIPHAGPLVDPLNAPRDMIQVPSSAMSSPTCGTHHDDGIDIDAYLNFGDEEGGASSGLSHPDGKSWQTVDAAQGASVVNGNGYSNAGILMDQQCDQDQATPQCERGNPFAYSSGAEPSAAEGVGRQSGPWDTVPVPSWMTEESAGARGTNGKSRADADYPNVNVNGKMRAFGISEGTAASSSRRSLGSDSRSQGHDGATVKEEHDEMSCD